MGYKVNKIMSSITDGALAFVLLLVLTLFTGELSESSRSLINIFIIIALYSYIFISLSVFGKTLGMKIFGLNLGQPNNDNLSKTERILFRILIPFSIDIVIALSSIVIVASAGESELDDLTGLIYFLWFGFQALLVTPLRRKGNTFDDKLSGISFVPDKNANSKTRNNIKQRMKFAGWSYLLTFSRREIHSALISALAFTTLFVFFDLVQSFFEFDRTWSSPFFFIMCVSISLIISHRFYRKEHGRINTFIGNLLQSLLISLISYFLVIICLRLYLLKFHVTSFDLASDLTLYFFLIQGTLMYIEHLMRFFRWRIL